MGKYRQDLLTFLDEPGFPFDNNLTEREIRPAVLMRENSFHNMSQDVAITQAVLMTIYRTLKLRGHDPIETIVSALRHYLSHNFTLPPLSTSLQTGKGLPSLETGLDHPSELPDALRDFTEVVNDQVGVRCPSSFSSTTIRLEE